MNETTWMQDGAAPHVGRNVRRYLQNQFGNRIIGRLFPDDVRGAWPWPARCPDLTPCDFWLWGYLKQKVYLNQNHATLDDLKDSIRRAVAEITPDQLRAAVHHVPTRMLALIANNGEHIEQLIS